MQKRASFQNLQTVYEPISFGEDQLCYTDPTQVNLPDGRIQKLHFHHCIEIGICRSGSGIFLFDDDVISICAGDCFYIPPATRHYSQAISAEPCCCSFVYVRQEVLQSRLRLDGVSVHQLLEGHAAPQVFRHGQSSEIAALAERLLQSTKNKNDPLCVLQIAELLLTMPDSIGAVTPTLHADPVSLAAEYMALHYREKLTGAELAAACHLSESQLRRRFFKLYGEAPHAYLNRLRCRIGAQMLQHTSRTVEDISEAVGFSSANEFFRCFKRIYAVSPSAWRKERAQQA